MTELRDSLMAIFNGRRDVYASQLTRTRMGDNGQPERGATWTLVESPLTDQLLDQHLAGKRTVGVYLHHPDSTVNYAVWDVDTRDKAPIQLLKRVLSEWEIDSLLFDSGSKGYHIVAAFAEPIRGALAYGFVRAIWEKAGQPEHVDLFPRQAAVTPERPYGNQVKLPLGIHRGTGRKCNLLTESFVPVAEGSEINEFDGLRRVPTSLVEQVGGVLAPVLTTNGHRITAVSGSEYTHAPYPCFGDLSTTPYATGQRDVLLFTFAKHLHVQQQPREFAELAVTMQGNRCIEPVPVKDSLDKVASVYDRGYTSLGCEEPLMAQFCRGAACSLWLRNHDTDAIPDSDQIDPDMPLPIANGELTLDDVRQFGTTEPQYDVIVSGRSIRVSLEQFCSWRKFRTAVMGELRHLPSLPKIPKETPQDTWERMVNLALDTSVLEDEPGDAATNAEIVQEALTYLRERVDVSPQREDILQGAAWEQADDEGVPWRFFIGKWIANALRGHGFRITNRELYRTLHPYGVRGVTLRVGGKNQYAWKIRTQELEQAPL